MRFQSEFSPVSLRYVAALRENTPTSGKDGFAYADVACANPDSLICLAASNPEGRFFGLVPDDCARRAAEERAVARNTANVAFLTGSIADTLARVESDDAALPPPLDFLCCDESAAALSETERMALFDLAKARLNPGGLLAISYRAYAQEDGPLRFLIQSLVPQMDSEQAQDFLTDIKKLGALYFSKQLETADLLDKAIANRTPKEFFAAFEGEPCASATFDTILAASGRGFAFAGDATIASNYVELAVPHEAQDLIVSCRNSPVYEPIKDFTLDRKIRSDIWVKAPRNMSSDPAVLFGSFAYGLAMERDKVPASFAAKGKVIDLSAQVFAKALDMMSVMPIGIGDLLSCSSCQNEEPLKLVETLQTLVACGIVNPMRGIRDGLKINDFTQPRLSGGFNRHLDKESLTEVDVLFSSQVAGYGLVLSAGEAFVVQAISRAGLKDSVSALMPELNRIADTPAARSVMNSDKPTPEIAHKMICDIAGKEMPTWYALALLEAA